MSSSLEPRVPAVFVPVRSMERSIEWYSKLLGLPTPDDYNGEMHLFRLRSGASIVLQRHDPVRCSPHVLFSLASSDVDAVCRFLEENGIAVVEINRSPGGSTVQFKDPDGHLLMAGDIW